MEKKAYQTTDLAGYFVANQRVPSARDGDGNRIPKVGHVLHLTEEEAHFEVLEGAIELVGESAESAPLSPPAKKKAASTDVEAGA